jgi:hypothetical protein
MEMAADARRALLPRRPQLASPTGPLPPPCDEQPTTSQVDEGVGAGVVEEWQAEQLNLESEAVASVISTSLKERAPAKVGLCFLQKQTADSYVRACGVATAPYRVVPS